MNSVLFLGGTFLSLSAGMLKTLLTFILLISFSFARADFNNPYLDMDNFRPQSYFIPFDFTDDDAQLTALAAASTIILFASDQEVLEFTQKSKGKVVDQLEYVGNNFGLEWIRAGAAAGLVVGVVTRDRKIMKYVLLAIKAQLISSMVTNTLKAAIHRPLPGDADGPYDFTADTDKTSGMAFPSGHTTAAFSLATFIAEETKNTSKVIPIIAYSMATLTAWARVHSNEHWPSDTIPAALIGHLVTKAVINSADAKKGFLFVPVIGPESFAFQVSYTNRSHFLSSRCNKDKNGNTLKDERLIIKNCIGELFQSE